MPIAAGASNLFFNRDTKVFVGSSIGRPFKISNTLISANVLTSPTHGLATGDRVMLYEVATGVTGLTLGTVYFAIATTAGTFQVATTLANAIAGTAATVTGTPSTQPVMMQLDGYVTPTTAIVSGTNVLTVTAFHNFVVGDTVTVSGITDTASLDVNGVYTVTTVSTTVSFTLTLVGATNATLTPGPIRIAKTILWEIPVLNGYSLSQGTSTSEITLNEMANAAGASRRGRQMFTDSMSPAEWSFETYLRPFKSTSHYAVEEPLWANFIANNYAYTPTQGASQTTTWAYGMTRDTADLEISFANSNSTVLGTFDLYFVLGANKVSGRSYTSGTDGGSTTIYKVGYAVVNELGLTFDIDGISSASWSGMGSAVTELGAFNGTNAGSLGNTGTTNFIRNRLTTLKAISTSPTATTYDITLTGGSITISNNITYLTPEVLGVVNKPIGHVTGTRTVSGSFSCYLDEVANGSVDLFQNIAERGNSTITNAFALDFYIGGGSGSAPTAPGVQVSMGQAHLEVPSLNMDDVISTEVNFHALPSTVGGTDEISVVRYIGQPL